MQIIFYTCTAERNRVDKTSYLSKREDLTGTLRDSTSIVNTAVTVQLDSAPEFNYAYIPEFKRYYFITDITAVSNKLWFISMTCDVLMTYRKAIRNCEGFIDRCENVYNLKIPDNKMVFENGEDIELTVIPNTYLHDTEYSFVLQGFGVYVGAPMTT